MNKKLAFILVITIIIIATYGMYEYYVNKNRNSETEMSRGMSYVEIGAYIGNPPGPNATQQEAWNFYNRIQLVAVQSNTLDITKCEPSPRVISVKKGTNLILKNNDSVIHTLAFNQRYSIAGHAQTETVINLDLGDFTGVFPYSCDMKSNAGHILVTE